MALVAWHEWLLRYAGVRLRHFEANRPTANVSSGRLCCRHRWHLLAAIGLTSGANVMLPSSGHGDLGVKPLFVVAFSDRQTACAWCGRAAHHYLDDLVVATSPPGDVLESAEVGLKLLCDSHGLALMERIFAPPPPFLLRSNLAAPR